VHDDAEWRGFCAALEAPALADDARFATNRLRVARREALDAAIEPILRARPAIWWLRVFARHGVGAGLAYDFETFRHHGQVLENGMIARLDTEKWGAISVGGLPWHFSRTPCAVRAPAAPGENTDEILACLPRPAPAA
jgi:crotonobetainyl-CoA:carnitine CoA-transferase CaiB-like acyl-CoA transferase